MNTLENINEYESFLKKVNSKEYYLIYFGASNALEILLNNTKALKPKYVCDNDYLKFGKIVFNHEVFNPINIFNKCGKKYIVIITSMYYNEICKQLEKYKDIEIIKPFQYLKQLDVSNLISNPKNILDEYTIDNLIGINIRIIFQNKPTYFENNFYDYLSYCNKKLIEDDFHEIEIFDAMYNCTLENYEKILEASIFRIIEKNQTTIVINSSIFNLNIVNKTKEILEKFDIEKFKLIESTKRTKRTKNNALIIHLYYIDMVEEIYDEILFCKDIFDIYLTITINTTISDIKKLKTLFPNAEINIYENRGRDILPFCKIYKKIYKLGYKSLCKIHTKKSPVRKDFGKQWSKDLRVSLFSNKDTILKSFGNNERKAFVSLNSKRNYLEERVPIINEENILKLCKYLKLPLDKEFFFPAGTMFWCEVLALKEILEVNIDSRQFVIESGILDGNLEHAIERLIGYLIKYNNYDLIGLE